TFNDLFNKKNLDDLDRECINNIVILAKMVVSENCDIEFSEEEISQMLDSLAHIDTKYYNILTINMYTIIFKYLYKKMEQQVKVPGWYTNEMLKYLRKVKIFFYDSFIFGTNYLT